MQEYCKSDRGSNEEWMNITKERVKQSLTQNGEIGPKTIQDLRQNQTSTTKSNVNNVLGKNSQMASSVVNIVFFGKTGQGETTVLFSRQHRQQQEIEDKAGRGPPPQSVCSLHGLNKGHWSYECRTLLRKKQIKEDKKKTAQSQAKTVNHTSSAAPPMAQSSMQNCQPYISQSCFQQMVLPPLPMFDLNMIQLQ
jgi:hypothetical protein